MSSVDLLNRLLAVHGRSLPIYLADAEPWVGRGGSEAVEVLQAIAADQQRTVDRIGELIVDEGGRLNLGGFPMKFTSYHDLSIDFMVTKLIEWQRADVHKIEAVVAETENGSTIRAIAEEALGAAKGHLQSLQELDANGAPA
jgi:hypothetical protein